MIIIILKITYCPQNRISEKGKNISSSCLKVKTAGVAGAEGGENTWEAVFDPSTWRGSLRSLVGRPWNKSGMRSWWLLETPRTVLPHRDTFGARQSQLPSGLPSSRHLPPSIYVAWALQIGL